MSYRESGTEKFGPFDSLSKKKSLVPDNATALNSVRNALSEATELSSAVESLVSRLIGGGAASGSNDSPSAIGKVGILPELQDFADRTTDRVREAMSELRRLEKELGE
ncbi:hypothetical protein RZ532_01150 [Nitratireductor aquimarinus]|uniref:hypothetical protein n=1 Tax=Nitratireductor aquimarinus TaxID=889300 RepID=UPI002936A3F3|nr:hypothetical protein [Nitratireductor aquimarinus]MDV2964568.1 hypothetical protein [Nitratireductor aquimarinus]